MDINFFFKNFINSNNYLEQFNFLKDSAIKEEYLGIFVYLCFAIFLAVLIVVLSYFLVTQSPETEKLSTYECGFEPYGDTRSQFNIRFYIIAILFILFDIEIIFLLPWCVSISQLNLLGFWSMVEFLVELELAKLQHTQCNKKFSPQNVQCKKVNRNAVPFSLLEHSSHPRGPQNQ